MLATACYAPNAQPGAPCGAGDACPTGQECRAGTCVTIGTPRQDALLDDAPLDDGPVDTAQITTDAPIDAPPYIPWGTPVLLTTLETPGVGETDPSVTSDKLTVVFAADTAANDADIYIATRTAVTDTFTYSLLAALNVAGVDDDSPEISGDGKTIYFHSARGGIQDIYVSTFSTVWSTPTIVAQLSTAGTDGDVAISPDGLMSIVVDVSNSHQLLFRSRANTGATFGTASQHTELHITTDVAAPSLTNNGDTVYFHAGAVRQLYVAHKQANGTYTTPAPISELNVAATRCAAPFVLQTDNYMIFEKAGDLYETTR